MAWIETQHFFDERIAILTLSRLEACQNRDVFKVVNDHRGAPSVMAAQLTAIVELARPDLRGCQLIGINFGIGTCEWEFVVSHPSLPSHRRGEILPRLPLLIGREDAPVIVSE